MIGRQACGNVALAAVVILAVAPHGCGSGDDGTPPASGGESGSPTSGAAPADPMPPQATVATTPSTWDEWLFTGDMGYMDSDGFLYVLGRYKSLLIADDGEKYSPEGIEEAFTDQSEYIDQCLLQNVSRAFAGFICTRNKCHGIMGSLNPIFGF